MITYTVYIEIKKNKKLGRNINQTANFLQISRQTVKKYWEMSNNEFIKESDRDRMRKRKSRSDKFKPEIADMLKDTQEIQASTVFDRLLENHDGEIDISERTVRRAVNELREVLGIAKDSDERDYQAVGELEPGQQAQVDFGEMHLRLFTDKGKRKKIYFFIMVLRYSRFKYIEFSDRKFTSKMAIEAHNRAFEFFRGIPREVVYDQDKVFIKSENEGDLIESVQFRSYLSAMPFTHRVARKADPETKGCVEKYVGFVKHNFLWGRLYKNIEDLNEKGMQWLERTGNEKVCQANNKKPADLIEVERQALYPIDKIRPDFEFLEIISHKVNKDNTVTYKGVRYRVPYGTYNKAANHEVGVVIDKGRIFIMDLKTHDQLINHPLAEKGSGVVGRKEPKPLNLKTTELVMEATRLFYSYGVNANDYLKKVCSFHERYIPDQMKVIVSAFGKNQDILDKGIVSGSLEVCMELGNYSAHEFKNILNRHCELARMDRATTEQMSAERSKELPEPAKAAFYEAETQAKDLSSMAKLTSMWEIVNEGEE